MGKTGKKTFRDGAYYAHVLCGKRTVKQGECAAVWTYNGTRKVIEGPQRVRLFFAHVRFLSRAVADTTQYLAIQYRDGRRENRRGPVSLFEDPCVHQSVEIKDAYRLAANEALIVYRELDQAAASAVKYADAGTGAIARVAQGHGETNKAAAAAAAANGESKPPSPTTVQAVGTPASVDRRIVRGPVVFVPGQEEWVHRFSWHGTKTNGKGSKTGTPDDDKVPHALEFNVLRVMPDQTYITVRDVRTKDDAQVAVHLMMFYELRDIERMLDSTNDPIGDFINATSADVMTFGAANTYEGLLEQSEMLSAMETFPTVRARMESVGFKLLKVVYRGYSTSPKLQMMHDEAIAKRTSLRLKSATTRVEQEEQAMLLRCKEERQQAEQEMDAASARHQLELRRHEAQRAREEKDKDHEQQMRHAKESADARLAVRQAENDEEVRRNDGLKRLGVDLTKLLCVSAERTPDQHLRIDSATPTQVHLEMLKGAQDAFARRAR